MNCKKCGAQLTPEDQFCRNCGEAVNSQPNNVEAQQPVEVTNNSFQQSNLMEQPVNNMQPNLMGQPANNIQPNYNSMNNNQFMNKPSNSGKYIAIGLAIIAVISAIIIAVFMIINKDDSKSSKSEGTTTNTTTTQPTKSNYKVNLSGFTFEIPDDLVYSQSDESLIIGDKANTWVVVLELDEGNFSQLKANKSQLQSVMQQYGYIASAATEKTLGGVDFITIEVTMNGQKAIFALAKVNSTYFIEISALSQSNEFDYKLLEKIAPIIKSAKYTGNATNNMSGINKIDTSMISELAK